ncbi:MAG: DEAD/DEAH box helicase [Deltaproteobacteria bacterium]|nr:DEAD/DEAH box helicase [Deltaproteobacteria bacterium]
MKFITLDLEKDILKGIEDAGFEKCTPVQEQSLPEALLGKDIIAQSQTGTGKTAVFLLSIFTRLLKSEKPKGKGPRALIMAPTRELAVQIDVEAKKLGKHLPFKSIAIYGGVEYGKQTDALKNGAEIAVGTPGRLIDLYKSKAFTLDNIEIFIVDEADRMFDIGFAPDIRYVADRLPKNKPRQTMLFSATIDSNVKSLASRYMKKDPAIIEIEPDQLTVDKIDQRLLYSSNEEKLPFLMTLLSRPEMERVIIFTNMKRTAEEIEWKLQQNGYNAKALTGDVTQGKRQRTIEDMKTGKTKILVATDVVARGVHIEDITHVINYDLPQEAASYVHRIGRTARAGKSGQAYSLVCEDHAWTLPDLEKYIEQKIKVEWLDEDKIVKDTAGPYRRRSKPSSTFGSGKTPAKKPTKSRAGAAGQGGGKRSPASPKTASTTAKKRGGYKGKNFDPEKASKGSKQKDDTGQKGSASKDETSTNKVAPKKSATKPRGGYKGKEGDKKTTSGRSRRTPSPAKPSKRRGSSLRGGEKSATTEVSKKPDTTKAETKKPGLFKRILKVFGKS